MAREATYSVRVLSNARLRSRGARTLIAVGAAVLVALGAAGPAAAAPPLADPPTITGVTGGLASGQLQVAYAAGASDGGTPVTVVEVSLDAGSNWFTCPDLSGMCPLLNLVDNRAYSIIMRSVNAAGPGAASAPATGTPTMPVGVDPDKPATLPSPAVRVTAVFDAAGNRLGVDGSTERLGVGTLPHLRFSRPITNKAAVERHLSVAATNDATGVTSPVAGSWGWLDDRTVVYRPKAYWPGRSTIRITSTMDRAVLGRSGRAAVIGSKKLGTEYVFRTARALVAKVDGKTHTMKVFVDGKKVKTFPVSLGTKDWETRNGVKVISTAKEPKHTYTSASLNITSADDTEHPEFYVLKDIPWNTRLTPTGEFMHAAPWAYGRLGRWNGSHGCTNMRIEDAKWVYEKTIPGDVALYTNTGGDTVEPTNGPGGLWNIPWEKWLKKSALRSVTGTVDTAVGEPVASLPDASA